MTRAIDRLRARAIEARATVRKPRSTTVVHKQTRHPDNVSFVLATDGKHCRYVQVRFANGESRFVPTDTVQEIHRRWGVGAWKKACKSPVSMDEIVKGLDL